MKLYTKEMFLIAAEKCEVSMIDAQHIIRYIDQYVTPIELPSENRMKHEAITQMEQWYGSDCPEEIFAFIKGAKWMRGKIQGGGL